MMNYWKTFGNIRGGKKGQGKKRGDERSLPNLGPCPNPFGQGNKLVIPMTMSKSKLVGGGGDNRVPLFHSIKVNFKN